MVKVHSTVFVPSEYKNCIGVVPTGKNAPEGKDGELIRLTVSVPADSTGSA